MAKRKRGATDHHYRTETINGRRVRLVVYRVYLDYPTRATGWSGFAEGKFCHFAGKHVSEAGASAEVRRLAAIAAQD